MAGNESLVFHFDLEHLLPVGPVLVVARELLELSVCPLLYLVVV